MAIEDSLEASGRSVLPALRAGGRCLDSQEMAGAVDVETRGAIEASEGAGGRGGCDDIQRWVRRYEAEGLEEVGRHRLGSGVRSYEAWTSVQGQRLWECGVGRTVSDDRGGDGLV